MNEHKNIITIEDEIKEFSDKPVKSSALFKAFEEKGVPDASEASAGDVLSLGEDKKPTWAPSSGGGMPADYPFETETLFDGSVEFVNTDGSLGDIIIPEGATLHVTVDDLAIDLSWDSDQGYWHDENSAVMLGNGDSGDPAWISVVGIPDGTYSVSVESMAIDENFRSGVEACAQSGPTSNVPELPDPSETQEPQYIKYNRWGGWGWSNLRPAPVSSMAAPYAGWVEGGPATFAKFPGHLDGADTPSSMRTDSLYMLAYQTQPGSGMSHWGVREIMKAQSLSSVAVGTTYTLKLKKTGENSLDVYWEKDT